MNLFKRIMSVMALLLFAGGATAGGISEGLHEILDQTDDTTPVKAMVFMRDQVDIEGLNLELRHAKATRAHRHFTVITQLQDLARATQGDLLAQLDSEKSAGRVVSYRTFTRHGSDRTPSRSEGVQATKDIRLHSNQGQP